MMRTGILPHLTTFSKNSAFPLESRFLHIVKHPYNEANSLSKFCTTVDFKAQEMSLLCHRMAIASHQDQESALRGLLEIDVDHKATGVIAHAMMRETADAFSEKGKLPLFHVDLAQNSESVGTLFSRAEGVQQFSTLASLYPQLSFAPPSARVGRLTPDLVLRDGVSHRFADFKKGEKAPWELVAKYSTNAILIRDRPSPELKPNPPFEDWWKIKELTLWIDSRKIYWDLVRFWGKEEFAALLEEAFSLTRSNEEFRVKAKALVQKALQYHEEQPPES